MKLDQEDYHPDWKTIRTTFKERSMAQIKDILNYFGKTHCMPKYFNKVTLNMGKPIYLNHLSMFLTPKDHTNLFMTAKNVILTPGKKEQDLQESSLHFMKENDHRINFALT